MPTNAQMYYLNTTHVMSLRHVSTLKRPSSGSPIDTFQQQDQQNVSPDVKFWKSKKLYIEVRL
jgi:hypothetical protein